MCRDGVGVWRWGGMWVRGWCGSVEVGDGMWVCRDGVTVEVEEECGCVGMV